MKRPPTEAALRVSDMLRLVLSIAIGLLWPLGVMAMVYFLILAVRENRRAWSSVPRIKLWFISLPKEMPPQSYAYRHKEVKYWAAAFATFVAMLFLTTLPRLLGVNPN
jgi:hypothetical protein